MTNSRIHSSRFDWGRPS